MTRRQKRSKYLTAQVFTTWREISNHYDAYDLTIIDGPARTSQGTLEIARYADLIVQPTGPSLADLKPAVHEFHSLVQAGIKKEKLVFALNHLATRSEEEAAREYLALTNYSTLTHSLLEKASYRLTQNEGKSVSEVSYQRLAKLAQAIVKEIIKLLAAR